MANEKSNIYKPKRYTRFEEKDGNYYFYEEGELRGYGMGAYSDYENKFKISKEEFERKEVLFKTIEAQLDRLSQNDKEYYLKGQRV